MDVTIHDIAAKLDISPSTVSRSLRQSSRVNPRTRAQVAAVAAQLGYQGLSRRRKSSEAGKAHIGLLLRSEESQSSPNAMRILHGMTAEADRANVLFTVHSWQATDTDEPHDVVLPAAIRENGCDAIVLEGRHDPEIVRLISAFCSVISVSWIYPSIELDAVTSDNRTGTCLLVDHLAELGHRRLAWVSEAYQASWNSERQAAFIQQSLFHQIPLADLCFFNHDLFLTRDEIKIDPLLDAVARGVTAFVCVNDRVAEMVISALESRGVKVPEQVSVTGYDAMFSADRKHVVTTIDPQFVELGRAALEIAARRVHNPCAARLHVAVNCRFVAGDTTGPVARS